VSPGSGLTTGGQRVKLVVSDLGAIALEGLPEVKFGGQICSGVSFKFFDTGNLEIKVTTPNDDAPGDTEVSVRFNRKTAEPITLTGRGFFEFIVPPDPFLDRLSLTINGESEGDIYAFNRISVEVTFTLKHLYFLRGDPFTIHLGAGIQYENSRVVAVATGDENDVRFSKTVFTSQTGTSLPVGDLPLSVSARGITLHGITLEARDAALPTIWGITPSRSRMSGGSTVLVAVSGMTGLPAVLLGLNPATVYGAVSLQSWKERNSAYQTLVGGTELSTYLAYVGFSFKASKLQCKASLPCLRILLKVVRESFCPLR